MIDSGGDGFRQHYRALIYYSDYLKSIFQNFLHGHFNIPHWDFAVSEGSDIITTFHYYGLGDVFTILCFLFPRSKMYLYYDFATFARLFATGVAFSELCFYKKKQNYWMVLTCSLIYAFCPFSFSNLNSHVFFISAAVFLPLIILGVEKVLNDDKPYVLISSVMLSALSNIYFFYMNVLSTIIFTFVRLLFIEEGIKGRLIKLIKVGLFSFLGVMMSCTIFLPMFYTMATSTRMDAKTNTALFYSLTEYRYMLFSLVHSEYTYYGGFTVLGLLAAVQLFFKKKEYTLKVLFLLAFLFISMPYFSKLYNAMVAPTDRWLYAVSLLMAYITIEVFNDYEPTNLSFILGLVTILGYFRYCFYMDSFHWQIYAVFISLGIITVIIGRFVKKTQIRDILFLSIILLSIGFNIFYSFSPNYWGLARNGTDIAAASNVQDGKNEILNQLNDDSVFRYAGDSLPTNESIHGDYSTTQYYWSVVDDNVVRFRKAVGISDRSNHHFKNYDDRFSLNALSGMKYYLYEGDGIIPYGFEKQGKYNGIDVYKNDCALPLIYGFDNCISEEEWMQLDTMHRNEALLQTAVLKQELSNKKSNSLSFESTDLPFEITKSENVSLQDKTISVFDNPAYLELECSYIGEGEYYLEIEGIESNDSTNMDIQYMDTYKTLYFKGKDNTHYADRHNFLINLGYLDKLDGTIKISFSGVGSFKYEDIKLYFLPLEKQIKYVNDLNSIHINEFSISENIIHADIDLSEDKIVCFAIPYSKGWKVYVDGEKTNVLQCNIQYMALELSAGHHQIDMKYETPMFTFGLIISLFGLAVLVFYKRSTKEYSSMFPSHK